MMKMHQLWKNTVLALSMMLLSAGAYAQHEIKGTVLDESQLPIPGANVVIKGTTTGTITAGNGEFTMKANDGDVLVVSYIGYTEENVTVNGNGPYTISLVPDMVGLSEVVVVGYGVQKKSNVTGAIASVKSEDLQHRSSPDAIQAMQGKAAGVTVLNSSGAPGAGGDIRVRGYSSNSGNIGPLIIVDGLQVDNMQYLDPEMIESMEILKDAASAAIYGAQAGNGVILITTKGGGKSDGNIFYNFQYSMNKIGQRAKMMNAEQYIQWNKEAGNFNDQDLENWGYNGEDTDWADVIFGTGVVQRHTIGAQGGNDKGSFYTAITNLDNNGIVKGDKDVYKRLSAQINADYKIKKWFSVSTNNSIEKWSKKSLGEHNEYAAGGSVFMSTTVMDPITPVYYAADDIPENMQNAIDNPLTNTHDEYVEVKIDGKTYYEKKSVTDTLSTYQKVYGNENGYYAVSKVSEGDAINPLITRDKASGKEEGFNFRGSLSADLKPIKGLVLTSRFGYRISQSQNNNFSVPYYANDKNASGNFSMSASASNNWYYQWENFANYNLTVGANDFGVMAGTSYTENNTYSAGGKLDGSDILSDYADNFLYMQYAKQDKNTCTKDVTGGTPNQSTSLSYFGRLSWSYDNRYNLQVNFRADAFDSSKLAGENRWGKFPSVSAGWTLSNEDFLKDALGAATISYLKFRASWGQNGNIAVLNNYPYSVDVSLNAQPYQFDVNNNVASYGSFPNGLANPDLKWETSEQIDLGLDGRLLDDKLSFAIDYYKKTTKDLLVPVTPVLEIGVTQTTINAGEVVNQGLEFELGWKDKVGDFSYSINGNAATLKNEVTYLDPSVDRIAGAKFANHLLQPTFEEGHSIWYMRGYEYAGVDAETGKPQFVDKDGNLTFTPVPDDMKDLGQGIPKFTYGITLNMEYKGFDFTVFGTGVTGNKIYACNYRTEHPKINGMELFYKGRSTVNEDGSINVGKYPTVNEMKTNTDFFSSTANLFNGSYFKIKQIQLGYTIPKSLTSKIAVSDFRLYVSLDDYFTFTKYEGFDPEVASNGQANSIGVDKGSYPTSKKITFGLNLTF